LAANKYFGDAGDIAGASEVLVDFGFEVELGELCRGLLQLCSVFLLFVRAIFCQVDFAESPSSEFFDQSEVFAYDQILIRTTNTLS
jgi:hypothetical protein